MPDNDRPFDLEFPLGGLNVAGEYQEQPAGTTPIATNVRGMNPDSRRERGGSRAGLIRYIPGPLFTGADAIQHLNVIVDPTGAAFQSEFEIPDIDWVEDPLNPGTFVPPGGWGYPTGAAPHVQSGSGILSIIVAMVGEGQTGTDTSNTSWNVVVTYTAGFADLEIDPGTNLGTICDDDVATLHLGANDYTWSQAWANADLFHSALVTEGYVGGGTSTSDVIASYDLGNNGPC